MSPDIRSFSSFCLSILFCILLIQIFHFFHNIAQFNMSDLLIFSILTCLMSMFCWYAFMTINNLESNLESKQNIEDAHGPGNYGFFPLHFLPIFWHHYSLFIGEK